MEQFKNYIASAGGSDAPNVAMVDGVLASAPWFTAARVVRERVSGECSVYDAVLLPFRGVRSFDLPRIDRTRLVAVTDGEIIDRFLHLDDYRIVADEEGAADDIATEAQLDEEDDLVSEELAEVYLLQGLKSEAVEIYRKLSLLNPEKSVYFAEKIENIENNK